MNSLRYLNTVLTVIAVLLGLNLWTAWMATPTAPLASQAVAQNDGLANSGAQRAQMIDQLKQLVQRTEELTSLFKNGNARVKVEAEKK